MVKPKAQARPARQTGIINELIAEARAADWNFNTWCSASGYEVSDPYVRRLFECLRAYAKRERGVGFH
jgi:hypothetical protein